MRRSTRFAIVGVCAFLCGVGIFASHSESARMERDDSLHATETVALNEGYQFAAARQRPKLSFQQLEAIIRRDPTAKSQGGRIEFGSVTMEADNAVAEVMFIKNDHVTPFLYKLEPEHDSWKIVNVQRMWYVPRAHLLRGVRA